MAGSSSCLRLSWFITLTTTNEQGEGHNQKADHVVNEQPKIDGRGTGLLCLGEGAVVLSVQGNEHVGEIDAARLTPSGGMTDADRHVCL